jgi:hypothetical protein
MPSRSAVVNLGVTNAILQRTSSKQRTHLRSKWETQLQAIWIELMIFLAVRWLDVRQIYSYGTTKYLERGLIACPASVALLRTEARFDLGSEL